MKTSGPSKRSWKTLMRSGRFEVLCLTCYHSDQYGKIDGLMQLFCAHFEDDLSSCDDSYGDFTLCVSHGNVNNVTCRVFSVLFLCLPLFQNSGIEKAFLFDVVSKIYIATDSSPVDMQTYELCCDMIDVVIDISCIYGSVDTSHFFQLLILIDHSLSNLCPIP